jgi:DNA-binding transcriptional LysR family regulator
MDRLRSIEMFIQVAQGRSFSGAAQWLGIARSNVTRHVGWLEKSLGTQLLARTTKSVRLTEAKPTQESGAPAARGNGNDRRK